MSELKIGGHADVPAALGRSASPCHRVSKAGVAWHARR